MEEHNDVIDPGGRFEFYAGSRDYFTGEVDRSPFVGYTIILHRPFSSTTVQIMDFAEAWETIENHCENYLKYCEIDNAIGDYLSSDEGRWGCD